MIYFSKKLENSEYKCISFEKNEENKQLEIVAEISTACGISIDRIDFSLSIDEAKKIVEFLSTWVSEDERLTRVMPRYFADIRNGCGAVRDKWHESYDKDYPGLQSDTPDVVEYKPGYTANGFWNMRQEDIDYLNQLCERLNNEA